MSALSGIPDDYLKLRWKAVPKRPPKPLCLYCLKFGKRIVHDTLPDARHFTPVPGTAQEKVWNERDHYGIVWKGGVDTGKSTLAAALTLRHACTIPDWRVLYGGQKYEELLANVVPKHLALLPAEMRVPLSRLKKEDTEYLALRWGDDDHSLTIKHGGNKPDSVIFYRSYQQDIQAIPVNESVPDEISSAPNPQKSIREIEERTRREDGPVSMRSDVRWKNTHVYYVSTNDTPDLDDWLAQNPDTHVGYTMHTWENPYNLEEWARMQTERSFTSAVAYRRVTGNYVSVEGKVLPFDKNRHVLPNAKMPKPKDCDYVIGGIDWGEAAPTVVLAIGVKYDKAGEPTCYIYDEFYERQAELPDRLLGDVFPRFREEYGITHYIADPSGSKSDRGDGQQSVFIEPCNHPPWRVEGFFEFKDQDWRIARIRASLDPLGSARPTTFIAERCQNTIKDLDTWDYKVPKGREWHADTVIAIPRRGRDHGPDAYGYARLYVEKRRPGRGPKDLESRTFSMNPYKIRSHDEMPFKLPPIGLPPLKRTVSAPAAERNR